MGKDNSCIWKQTNKKVVVIPTLDKIDFKTKAIARDKGGPSNSTSGYFI